MQSWVQGYVKSLASLGNWRGAIIVDVASVIQSVVFVKLKRMKMTRFTDIIRVNPVQGMTALWLLDDISMKADDPTLFFVLCTL